MIWFILGIGLGMRTISLNQSFWLDEAAQAVLSAKPLHLIPFAKDFQPPFFYALVHPLLAAGIRAEWMLRLPSVFFGLLTIGLTYLLMEKITDSNKKKQDSSSLRPSHIAALLVATSPYLIYFSQEFRMYSLLTCLGLAAWVCLAHRKWLLYSLILVAGMYTHYFFVLIIVSQIVWMAHMAFVSRISHNKDSRFSSRILPFTISIFTAICAFLPWFPTLQQQITTSRHLIQALPGWQSVSNPGFIKFIPLTFAKFTVGMISPPKLLYGSAVLFFSIIIGYSLVMTAYSALKRKTSSNSLWLLLHAIAIPLGLAWGSSLWLAASSPWRIQFVLPFIYCCISLVLIRPYSSQFHKKLSTTVLTILIMLNISFSATYLFNPINHREDWRGAVAYTDNLIAAQPETLVMTEFNQAWAPIEWYTRYPANYSGGCLSLPCTPDNIKSIPTTKTPILVYDYLATLTDPQHNLTSDLTSKSFHLCTTIDFHKVGFINTYRQTCPKGPN